VRRRVLSIALVALLGVAADAVPAVAAGPDEWGQAAAHATGDSINPGESALTPAVAGKIKPRWTVPLGTLKCAAPSYPLVGANRLITAESYRISGYDPKSGALKWRTPVDGNRDITLVAVVGGTLIAEYRKCHSGKAYLTALDATTGVTKYTRQIAAPMYGMVVDHGMVVGGAWDASISKYVLRGYRISDGVPVWSRVGSVFGATVSAGGHMMMFGDEAPAVAIDVTTGKTVWSAGAGCFTPIGAASDGSTFFVRCDPDDRIRTVEAATGKLLATFPDHGSTYGFATDGERVYVHTFDDEGLLAMDAATGKKVWRASFADSGPFEFSLGGGVVYGLRGDGKPLAAFAASTGVPIGLTAKTSAIENAPVVAKGRLYGRTGATLTSFAP
jgi:outer membrane protein assembly factor BamB